ncbi:unnamed protein product [Sphagnum troendelagicum]|uniref:Uncharacterized protein n=1 Tax=Sphagnum jensenii TaxID=128206 RepID=A0ABP0VYU8_9BRYO
MSAASCLLQWRTSPALATLFRNQNHQTRSFASSFSARRNVHWGFATSEVQRFSPATLFLQSVTAAPGDASVTPPPSPGPDNPSGSSSGSHQMLACLNPCILVQHASSQ